MHMHKKSCGGESGNGSAVGAGIIGAIIGAIGTYYLYMTKGGQKNRKEIGRMAEDVKDKAIDMKDELVKKGKDYIKEEMD